MHTAKLGSISCAIMLSAVICPPIHSMVVVTSPKGDQAPPALAAITIVPANQSRSSLSCNNLVHNDTITMAVVRLSSRAERKNEIPVMINNSLRLLVVFIFWVMISKPLCESISSTIVIAPNKKKRMEAVSPKWCSNASFTMCISLLCRM